MAKSWKDAWAESLSTQLQAKVTAMAAKGATQGSEAIGGRFAQDTVLAKLSSAGEARNVTCCLGWTSPLLLSPLNEDLSLAMVQKFVDGHWKVNGEIVVPAIVPRNWSIPIGCTSLVELPVRGSFPRVEGDLAALAPWKVLAELATSLAASTEAIAKERIQKLMASVEKHL